MKKCKIPLIALLFLSSPEFFSHSTSSGLRTLILTAIYSLFPADFFTILSGNQFLKPFYIVGPVKSVNQTSQFYFNRFIHSSKERMFSYQSLG